MIALTSRQNLKLKVEEFTRMIQAMSMKWAFTLEDVIGNERNVINIKTVFIVLCFQAHNNSTFVVLQGFINAVSTTGKMNLSPKEKCQNSLFC